MCAHDFCVTITYLKDLATGDSIIYLNAARYVRGIDTEVMVGTY
jgi:hypothetical protein